MITEQAAEAKLQHRPGIQSHPSCAPWPPRAPGNSDREAASLGLQGPGAGVVGNGEHALCTFRQVLLLKACWWVGVQYLGFLQRS